MSTTLVPTAGALPQGFCPTTEQERLDEYCANTTIELPDYYGQFVVSSTTPSAGDQDKIWLKLDGSNNPIGWFKYVSGAWTQIDPPNVWYGALTGSANTYALSLSNYPSTLAPVTGHVFVVKIPTGSTNTGASTVNLNAFGAKAVKSAGSDVWSSALVADRWYTLVYDGTNYELTNNKQLLASDVPAGSDGDFFRTRNVSGTLTSKFESPYIGTEQSVPSAGGSVTWSHSLGAVPIHVQVRFRCKTADFLNYSVNDEVDALSAFGTAGNDQYLSTVIANSTQVVFVRNSGTGSGIQIANKTTGSTAAAITEANWKLVCYAIR
jgi:hypothetical protein